MPATPNWTPEQREAARQRHEAKKAGRRAAAEAAQAADDADRAFIDEIVGKLADKLGLPQDFTFIACRRGKPCIVGKGRKNG